MVATLWLIGSYFGLARGRGQRCAQSAERHGFFWVAVVLRSPLMRWGAWGAPLSARAGESRRPGGLLLSSRCLGYCDANQHQASTRPRMSSRLSLSGARRPIDRKGAAARSGRMTSSRGRPVSPISGQLFPAVSFSVFEWALGVLFRFFGKRAERSAHDVLQFPRSSKHGRLARLVPQRASRTRGDSESG